MMIEMGDMPLYDPSSSQLDRRVYSDPAVLDLELDRIFGRSWLLAGHEDLAPAPGDFGLGGMGADLLLFWRGLDGELRVFLNFCPGSGLRFCLAESGNAASMRCGCHRVEFGSDGVALSGERSLISPARVEQRGGLTFASHEADAEPLEAALGDFAVYLDEWLAIGGSSPRFSTIIRSTIDANWKLPMEAFAGGLYREHWSEPAQDGEALVVWAGAGGLLVRKGEDVTQVPAPRLGMLFPNVVLSWQDAAIHIFQPRTASQTEVWSFFLVDGDVNFDEREAVRLGFQRSFAPGSLPFEDLAFHWQEITRLSASPIARQQPVRFDAGPPPSYNEDLPGLVAPALSDFGQRSFYEIWLQEISRSQ